MDGIWQDVFLLTEPQTSIGDVSYLVQPWVDRDELRVSATVTNQGTTPATFKLSGDISAWINEAGKSVLDAPEVKWKLGEPCLYLASQEFTVQPGESKTVLLTSKVTGRLRLWSPDSPNLYGLLLKLSSGGKPVDNKYQRFGWRQFTSFPATSYY